MERDMSGGSFVLSETVFQSNCMTETFLAKGVLYSRVQYLEKYKVYNLLKHYLEVQVSNMKALLNFGDLSQTA